MWKRAAGSLILAASLVGASVTAASAMTPSQPVSASGQWITDSTGRVVIMHGLNQVYKVAPYLPSADGFGNDDAVFLAKNGFNAMRIGVIWAGVEPRPGVYNNKYLAGIAQTVHTLAMHGIATLLDFHQDIYSAEFQGEGAPAWATQDGGLPNPPLGFSFNDFANPAENHAWDAFWANVSGPGGRGLQDYYAAMAEHVATYFRGNPSVVGYEVMNEPWPGAVAPTCLIPLVGCPIFDQSALSTFYAKVGKAIRAADSHHMIWMEPAVVFNEGIPTHISMPGANTGFAFHDYCLAIGFLNTNVSCPQEDGITFSNAGAYVASHHVPGLMTEFGATSDLPTLTSDEDYADQYRVGWLEWAYTGNDITSASSTGQPLVFDPAKRPAGNNVNMAKLKVLARPYPQVVAGTPLSWSVKSGVFQIAYSTARVSGRGRFGAGSITDISTPPIEFPSGYSVQVRGGRVVSARDARILRIASVGNAATIAVTVRSR